MVQNTEIILNPNPQKANTINSYKNIKFTTNKAFYLEGFFYLKNTCMYIYNKNNLWQN